MMQPLRDRRHWPETKNYLERVGQINNDLMLAREIAAREETVPDWLEDLTISTEDLTEKPEAVALLKLLHRHQLKLHSLEQMEAYKELAEEHAKNCLENGEAVSSLLEATAFTTMGPKADEQLYASPELESVLIRWAEMTLEDSNIQAPQPTMVQALMLAKLSLFLEQEPGMNPVWEAESKRSLLSSSFYSSGGNRTKKSD
ncbi:hypothetical protein JSO19_03840 [Leucobacter sp. UCMA 4100]|uniref:hypothetical protein n=1 Tax=Leucobacter sp. UCMA 4100 TaxID=2810534 RepID=UPI0022EB7F66|nr:hypothetical protein [Leucobacter sp. UCMA 4100]MDA3146507.1 hypothetical protein [Leucobacter sp. UCMA 4100]